MSDEYKRSALGMREMANGPEIRAALTLVAEAGKTFAEGLAQEFRRTGDYAGSFGVAQTTVLWRRGPRAAVRLEDLSDHAAAVEWGNAHDEHPHRVLGRTLDTLRSL